MQEGQESRMRRSKRQSAPRTKKAQELHHFRETLQGMYLSLGQDSKKLKDDQGNPVSKGVDLPINQEFQAARLAFQGHLQSYEQLQNRIRQTSTQFQKQTLKSQAKEAQKMMCKALTTMLQQLEIKNKKLKDLNKKHGEENQIKKESLETETTYYELVVCNCKRIYEENFGKRARGQNQARGLREYQEVGLRETFLEEDEQERLLFESLQKIDKAIDDQLDEILNQVHLLKSNAARMSDAIQQSHKKIILNLKKVEDNIKMVGKAGLLAQKVIQNNLGKRKSGLCLDLALMIVIGVMCFLLYKILVPSASSGDSPQPISILYYI